MPDKGGLVAGLRGHGAHHDHSLVTIDAGAPGGQVVDIPRHDELDDAVQTAAQAQIVGEIVQSIVDHGSVLFRVGQKLLDAGHNAAQILQLRRNDDLGGLAVGYLG